MPAPATTTYRCEARTEPGQVARARAKQGEVLFDVAPAGGTLPGPAELLATAFAACLLKNVERFSGMLGFAQSGAAVAVEIERRDQPPRFTRIAYTLTITTDESPARLDLLHRNLRRHGTVYNTLAAVCAIEGHIRAEPAPGSSA